MDSDQKLFGIKQWFHAWGATGWLGMLLALTLMTAFHLAQAQAPESGEEIGAASSVVSSAVKTKFDHSKTGFILTGAHVQARCDYCHIQAVYKGTPRECVGCHIEGNRMGAVFKPARHINTIVRCDTCHKTTAWVPATFSHVTLEPGSCLTCHNGSNATGKPSGHLPVTTSCDNCHKTLGWVQQTKFSHAGITSGCATCHGGQSFSGISPITKSMNHPQTSSLPCESCHLNTTTFQGSTGGTTLPVGHFTTTQMCTTCHSPAHFVPGVMNHTGITNDCAQCHGAGKSFLGVGSTSQVVLAVKGPNHFPTQGACENCHNANDFNTLGGAVMNHVGIVNNCVNCHHGVTYPVGRTPKFKTTSHLPTNATCETCHSISNFATFNGSAMVHTGIVSGCVTCHSGNTTYQEGMIPKSKASATNHMVTTAACETCHSSTTTFLVATGGTVLPSSHFPTTQACAVCHTSANFVPAVMSHTGITSGCANCHSVGRTFLGVTQKTNAGHFPTSAACESCHSTTNFFTFSGTAMKHDGVTSGCASCHTGQNYAGGVVKGMMTGTNHFTATSACETCHSISNFTTFSGTRMVHAPLITSGCASCHNGVIYTGVSPGFKKTTHLPTTLSCETCHSTSNFTTFSGTGMVHTGIVSGCATCHSNTTYDLNMTPKFKSTAHMTTTAACETCHSSTTTFLVATGGTVLPSSHFPTTQACAICHTSANFIPGVMNHTGITTGCASCHTGLTYGAGNIRVKGMMSETNHFTTTSACETCHSISNFTTFSGTRMVHAPLISSGCASCHNGVTYTGVSPGFKKTDHLPTTLSCETCHSTSNFITFSGTGMVHTGIVSGCATCHSGLTTYQVGMIPKSKSFLPTHIVTTSPCETCHSSTSTFLGATGGTLPANHFPTTQTCSLCHVTFGANSGVMHHDGITSGCLNCHTGGTYAGNVVVMGKDTLGTHFLTSAACESCHSKTNFTTFSGTVMNHTGIASGCLNCHNGGTYAVNVLVKSMNYGGTHFTTSAACETCHLSTSTFTGTQMVHTGIVSGCVTCHTGGAYNGVVVKGKDTTGSNHFPITSTCESCHSISNFTTFSGTNMSHALISSGCASCHTDQTYNGNVKVKGMGTGSPAHLPTSASPACETCHSISNFTTFNGTTMQHTLIVSGCATCHGGQAFQGVTPKTKGTTSPVHVPTTASPACETCHSITNFFTFSGTAMVHAGITTGCASCHTSQVFQGVTPVYKNTTSHLPTTLVCETCHLPINFGTFSGTAMVHTGITTGCITCHAGTTTYQNNMIPKPKPSNHIVYSGNLTGGSTMACEFCHTPTYFVAFTSLTSSTIIHNGTQGNGSGWCKNCHATGVTANLGVTGPTKSVTHDSASGTDCSQSGCHRPLGTIGTTYVIWK